MANSPEKDENENISKQVTQTKLLDTFYQHLGVTFFSVVFLILGPTCLFLIFVLPFLTEVWWPSLLYMTWWLWDLQACNTGGRSDSVTKWVRKWPIFKYYADYFPIKIVKTCDLPPEKNYIFCCHPHGVLCYGVVGAMGSEGANVSEIFPGIKPKLITLEGSFWMPGMRELLLGSGACSSSKASLHHLLTKEKGVAPALMVGGLPEISNYHEDKIVLVIKKRKGFVKLALETGSQLVPVFSFGEKELFYQPAGYNSFLEKHLVNKIGFYPVAFSGRGYAQNWFGILPRKQPIHVVVGEPIQSSKIDAPSHQDIESLHERYIKEVEKLHNAHKASYGCENIQLEII